MPPAPPYAPLPPQWRPPGGPLPPPAKKSGSGCLVALGIVAGIVVLLAVIVGVVIYRAANSPEGRKVLGMVRDTARVVGESATAPGTKELREMGCETAMVMDLDAWVKVFARDGGPPRKAGEIELFVICGVRLLSTPPSCDQVGRTYVTAVGAAKGPFQAMVQKQGNNRPICAACFDASGAPQACPRGALHAP